MKSLKYILFLLLIAFIGLAVYVAVQPNSFEVKKSVQIKAPVEVIQDVIKDTSEVDFSSFWKQTETLERSYTSSDNSMNQTYTSTGIPKSQLVWQLEPYTPGTIQVTRKLAADKMSFWTKAKYVLTGGNKIDIEDQFEKDLETLNKRVVNSMEFFSINVDGITEHGGGFYMYKTTSSTSSNIGNLMALQFAEVAKFMMEHNIPSAGKPFTIYNTRNPDGSVIMSNAIPVSNMVTVAEDSNVLCGFMNRTRVIKTTMKGDRINREAAWSKTIQYLTDNELQASEIPPFEIQINDPAVIPNPSEWVTELYLPLKEEVLPENPTM